MKALSLIVCATKESIVLSISPFFIAPVPNVAPMINSLIE